jgi:transitional endoplasmic reticulum ATPase
VLWIAATNRPDLMDPAMKRPGRFDIRIPLLYPDKEEKAAIFQVMFTKYDLTPAKNVNYPALAEIAEDFSGADIEAVVLEAARYADADGEASVSQKNLVDSIDDYIIHYDRDAIKEMEKVALSECNSVRLLPPRYRDVARSKKGTVKTKVEAKEV